MIDEATDAFMVVDVWFDGYIFYIEPMDIMVYSRDAEREFSSRRMSR